MRHTVKSLIEKLKEFPEEAYVGYIYDGWTESLRINDLWQGKCFLGEQKNMDGKIIRGEVLSDDDGNMVNAREVDVVFLHM